MARPRKGAAKSSEMLTLKIEGGTVVLPRDVFVGGQQILVDAIQSVADAGRFEQPIELTGNGKLDMLSFYLKRNTDMLPTEILAMMAIADRAIPSSEVPGGYIPAAVMSIENFCAYCRIQRERATAILRKLRKDGELISFANFAPDGGTLPNTYWLAGYCKFIGIDPKEIDLYVYQSN